MKKPEKRPRGRPCLYTDEVATRICEELATGKPLTRICAPDDMPATRTISDWCALRPEFAARFADARARGFDAIADDCLAIADDTTHDTVMVGADESEREAANTEWISRSKLRVETRLKLLAKWDPKRYGERTAIEHSGEIGISERMTRAENKRKGE